jgi:hypothetical protein
MTLIISFAARSKVKDRTLTHAWSPVSIRPRWTLMETVRLKGAACPLHLVRRGDSQDQSRPPPDINRAVTLAWVG